MTENQYSVVYSADAKDDLWRITRYIADTLAAPQTALKVAAEIRAAILDLFYLPERFQKIWWEPWQNANLHIMPVNNYLVIYRVIEESKTVGIVRILHGRQHLDAFLEKIERENK